MDAVTLSPDGPERIEAAWTSLNQKRWGEGSLCVMSALMDGPRSIADCVSAGWPRWLCESAVALFDAPCPAAVPRRRDAAREWAKALAGVLAVRVDPETAKAAFAALVLRDVAPNEPESAVKAALLHFESDGLPDDDLVAVGREVRVASLTPKRAGGLVSPAGQAASKAAWHALNGEYASMLYAASASADAEHGHAAWVQAWERLRVQLIEALSGAAED